MVSTQSSIDPAEPLLPPVKLDPLAGFLSYLIPGLGQVYQGRVGKGLLFFFGLYLLFFYGMWMGQWRNVWLPDVSDMPQLQVGGNQLKGVPSALWYRPQFMGQFWIGTAAWPAVVQYVNYDRTKDAGPIFGKFQRMPGEEELNDIQRKASKRWDLGWVYTVIAGVLNLLVIYDAFAGAMFRDPPRELESRVAEAAKRNPASPIALATRPPAETANPPAYQPGGSP